MVQPSLPKTTESYWRASVDVPAYEKLTHNIQVDIGIVGGGITGITAAYLLSRQGFTVCLVDSGTFFSGTTGNTTAKITVQHGLIYDELVKHFGLENAQKYYQSNQEAHQFIEKKIKEYKIACHYTKDDAYLYAESAQFQEQLETEYVAYEKLHISSEVITTTALPFKVKNAIVMKDQAYFHPLYYLQTLLEKCEMNNVQLFENTRAITVEYTKNPSIITEDNHRITCRYVIQASHYPFYDGTGFYPIKMYADRAYVIAAKTKKVISGMYINAETPTRSIRPALVNGEQVLLFAGENHKTGQSKVPMMNHYSSLSNFANTHFTVEHIPFRWSAQDYTTLDKIPYIGRVTKHQHNVFVATGFRKWGMTNGTNAAQIITDLILEKENPYAELYSPSRNIALDPSLRKIIMYNADVAKHLVKGKLENPKEKISSLKSNEACVVIIKGNRVGIYKNEKEKLFAVDTTCTHLGCELQWNNAETSWDCPCHGSRFTIEGEIINGPAEKPLRKIKL